MRSGTVIRWDRFPYPKYGGERKARWFVCLGDTGPLLEPIIVHLCTTTTQKSDFQKGGRRSSHRCYLIEAEVSPFEEDCLIDFDESPYQIERRQLEGNSLIEVKGVLDEKTLKAVYDGILQSRFYSRRVLMDIHASLNRVGITGLKKPK